jgi:hypothetical protein
LGHGVDAVAVVHGETVARIARLGLRR